ncbi:HD-GYP domain-containing protein [Virgibacillus sp. W0181]|uniref:HD-GYP domain-containing protein n=1 Tax=Virgibacillus sp. W0181 TaxID=3391581 RepID=UPI003F48BB6A
MRLVSTRSVKPGTKIAQSIYNENNLPLIQKGTALTEKMIHRLLKQHITYVHIEDALTDDIYVEDVIPAKTRIKAMGMLKETFVGLKKDDIFNNAYILETKSQNLLVVIDELMKDIRNSNETISMLTNIFATDDYIFQHSINVAIYSLAIGSQVNLPDAQLAELGVGAILHDIGKIFIEEEILQKADKLTADEFAIMKTHTELGYNFLRKQNSISSVAAHCAYQHHERLDGSGYPRGIKGDAIHPFGKIIAIADVFDAVTSNRVYRSAMLPHEGLEILYAGAIQQFEKQYVEAFKQSVSVYPNGLTVRLNDGRTGVVIRQNKTLCDRPVIRIIKDASDQSISPYEVDMAYNVQVLIHSCQA